MQSLWFWNDWSAPERKLFWCLATPVLLIMGLFGFIYFQYPSLTFIYEQFQEIRLLEISLRSFTVGLSSVDVPADNLLLFETFSGSALQPIPWIFYTFLICLVVGLLVFLTFITTLKRFSFFTGIGFFILILVTFHIETLQLFGFTSRFSTIALVAFYGAAAFLFHHYYSNTRFHFRLLIFLGITGVFAAAIPLTSHAIDPFLHLAVNGILTGFVMSIIFMIMVGHEIVASFVSIVTNVKKPTKSAQHYYVLSAIYLGNLIITFLIREKYLYWDIVTVNSIFLLAVAGIIGLWGLLKREPLYSSFIDAPSTVIYLYLGFFLTTFATISFCFATDSSTMMEGFNDLILFTQLGYSIIFTAYVTANFAPMLMANLAVHKILYKPSTMPFFTFRTMSLIATFAFLSYSSPLTTYIDRATAAYYNAYGDLYQMQNDITSAEAYYKKSIFHRNQNHHAHYALATLYSIQLDPAKAVKEYNNIINNTPTEITYLNLSDLYAANQNYADAEEVLTAGLKIFPSSGILLNAQAFNYSEQNRTDSALLFYQKARKNPFVKDAAETNLFATGAQIKLAFPADSLLSIFGSEDAGTQSNAFALANVQRLPLTVPFKLPADTLLTVKMATLLSNQITNQGTQIDTALLAPIVALARKPCNENFKEYLLVAAAHCYYRQGRVRQASELLREMAYYTGRGKYFNLLGIWLLEQHNPATAALYFKTAQEKQISSAVFSEALAWTEADSSRLAIPRWDSLTHSKDSLIANQAILHLQVLRKNQKELLQSDEHRYAYCRYRIPPEDSLLFQQVVSQIEDDELRTKALLDRSKKWFTQDEPYLAIKGLSPLKGIKLTNKTLVDDILFLNLLLSIETGNWDYLQKKIEGDLPAGYLNEKIYLRAALDEHQNRLLEAKKKFEYLSTANVQFEEGLVGSSRFFAKDSTDRLKPYSILVTGLLAKPNSIKLLKAHAHEAALLGFTEEAEQSVERLRKLMKPLTFKRYLEENPIPH